MKSKKYYICHPYETYGDIETNLKKEEAFYNFLCSYLDDVELIRPFMLVPKWVDREEAMKMCFYLLDSCDGIVLAPDWAKSEGCCLEYIRACRTNKDMLMCTIKNMWEIPED